MTRLEARLLHAVTNYDMRVAKRKGHNIYALAHYMNSIKDNVLPAIAAGKPLPEALQAGFCGGLLVSIAKSLKKDGLLTEEEMKRV